MNYVNQFLQLRCSPDVLEIVNPLGNKVAKEISESMAVIKYIKRITIAEPMKYGLVDLCAGNALTSVLAVHLLPIVGAIAIDKRPRQRKWERTKRFKYDCCDIYRPMHSYDTPYIICAIHCCGKLAKRVIEIYLEDPYAKHLIMMPCCNGRLEMTNTDKGLREIIDGYQMYVYQLAKLCNGYFTFDKNCLSPKNGIIVASKPSPMEG